MKYCGFDVARMGNDYSVLTNITVEEKVRVDRIDFFSKIELMEAFVGGAFRSSRS